MSSSFSPAPQYRSTRRSEDMERDRYQRVLATQSPRGLERAASKRTNPGPDARQSTIARLGRSGGREEWRRGTVFSDVDEFEESGESSRRTSERSSDSTGWMHRYSTSVDHSSDDGRNDYGPVTPPESTANDSDDEEIWVGRTDKVPEWAAPDIVECYRNGWGDDTEDGPTSDIREPAGKRPGEHARAIEYSWRKDAEDGDYHSQSELHLSSSGRSVLPAGRLLLNTLSEEGPNSDSTPPHSPFPPVQRPRANNYGDARRAGGNDLVTGTNNISHSVTNLSLSNATAQLDLEEFGASRPGPRLRGMRSMLLTRPVAPRSNSEPLQPGLASREIARSASASPLTARSETTSPVPSLTSESRRASLAKAPAYSPRAHIPPVHSMSVMTSHRQYHYQKAQSVGHGWASGHDGNDSIKSPGSSDERARATSKKDKPAQLSALVTGRSGDDSPLAWRSAGSSTTSFMLTPPSSHGKSHFSPPSSPQDALLTLTGDSKSTKEKKKKRASRMSYFVGKVFSAPKNSSDGARSKTPLTTLYVA